MFTSLSLFLVCGYILPGPLLFLTILFYTSLLFCWHLYSGPYSLCVLVSPRLEKMIVIFAQDLYKGGLGYALVRQAIYYPSTLIVYIADKLREHCSI